MTIDSTWGQPHPHRPTHSESFTDLITKSLGILAPFPSDLLDLQPVLVCSRCEPDLSLGLTETRVTCEDVGEEERVEVAYVRGCSIYIRHCPRSPERGDQASPALT
jgi:hypothetical protein